MDADAQPRLAKFDFNSFAASLTPDRCLTTHVSCSQRVSSFHSVGTFELPGSQRGYVVRRTCKGRLRCRVLNELIKEKQLTDLTSISKL